MHGVSPSITFQCAGYVLNYVPVIALSQPVPLIMIISLARSTFKVEIHIQQLSMVDA